MPDSDIYNNFQDGTGSDDMRDIQGSAVRLQVGHVVIRYHTDRNGTNGAAEFASQSDARADQSAKV